MVAQPIGDARPEVFWERLDGIAECSRGLAQAVELRTAARARREVLLELRELGTVDRVERVRAKELRCVFV
jgi:hypothetical protein